MIPLIQLPYHSPQARKQPRQVGPMIVALVLGLILCVQIGLVLWVFFKQRGL